MIDGIEQNRFYKSLKIHPRLFGLKNYDTLTKIIKWETNSEYDWFEAEHYGYQKLKDPVIHKRKIFFDKKREQIEITDAFDCKETHRLEWFFHFNQKGIEQNGNNPLVFKISYDDFYIKISPNKSYQDISSSLTESWYSKSYGKKQKSKYIQYTTNGNNKSEYKFLLEINR